MASIQPGRLYVASGCKMRGSSAIQAKCFHPTGTFVEFKKEDVEQSIPDRFESIVRMYPERLALRTRSHELTYDELNKAANRVGHAVLSRCAEGRESIALLLEHGAAVIAGIFGVLKAGKIYVPLDPSLPHARITYLLENSQAGIIVTNNRNLSLANKLAKNVLQVTNIDELGAGLSTKNLGLSLSPDRLAWILYTSGSTGHPKGVVQDHRNVLHETMIYTNNSHICSNDRLVLVSSCSFADSVRTINAALLNGASLFPFDIKEEGLPSLANWLIEQEITIYRSVPTLFRHFAGAQNCAGKFPKLRLIYLGGEPVYRRDVKLYKTLFPPSCIFVNGLGSTESLTFRMYFIDTETPIRGSNVPVGYPIEDKDVVLLDGAGKEVGFNRVGEIAVKSRYLSPGYWQRPDLTQSAFLPDPEGGNERVYLTGDLGSMSSDGLLQHHGRKDFQVKIRGYRVETSEIEMNLLKYSAVKDAVVAAREDPTGDQRLVAYLVPSEHPTLAVSDLRRFLREKLPNYMIPSAFVVLDSLPLTPTGKLDRNALPLPEKSRPELDTLFVAPKTSIEKKVAQIWTEVLSLDQVGIQDNFFDLGGHSLAATRVISRVINTFKVEMPIKSLFESPTVSAMVEVILQNEGKRIGDEELSRMLAEVETLSDEEAKRQLADEGLLKMQ